MRQLKCKPRNNERGKSYSVLIWNVILFADIKQEVQISSFQALSQGNNHEAVVYVQRCKDMLLRLPKDVNL